MSPYATWGVFADQAAEPVPPQNAHVAHSAGGCTLDRFKSVAWRLTCGLRDPLRGPVVLVDHPAEYLPPLDRQVQRNADLVVLAGWSLLTGLMRAVPVVMAGVLARTERKCCSL